MLAAVTQARDEESFDRLGVVVVNHAAPTEVLNDAMLRLRASAPGARVILVATGTGTPSPEAGWPEDTEIVRVPNRSYAHAVNAGFAMLDGVDLLTMMNDDVLVEPRTFADLVIALRAHPGTGLAGPIPRDASGRPQDLGVPYRLAYARARKSASGAAKVAWLAGCLVVVTREAYVATGGHDQTFRFTNEDIDLSLRARELGYTSLLVDTEVTHLGGTSTPTHPAFHVEGRRGGYLITERHLPRAAAAAHRAYLVLEGGMGALLGPTEGSRAAHRTVARMALTASWHTGPFGPSLDDR